MLWAHRCIKLYIGVQLHVAPAATWLRPQRASKHVGCPPYKSRWWVSAQKRQSARLQAAAGASSSGGRARAAAVGLAAAAAACDSDGAADLVEAALTTDPKMRKLRLKNKNAQKRFRDRQKVGPSPGLVHRMGRACTSKTVAAQA